MGLKSGYHTALVMGGVNSKIHAKRLAQACEVKIELRAAGEHFSTNLIVILPAQAHRWSLFGMLIAMECRRAVGMWVK